MWRSEKARTGFDEAIYWIELLLEFGSFDHLKINDGDLNLLQYFCVDVVLFFIVVFTLFVILCIKVAQKMVSRIFGSKIREKIKSS